MMFDDDDVVVDFNYRRFSDDCKSRKISNKDLSTKTGMPENAVMNIKYGRKKNVTKNEIKALCEPFGLNPDLYYNKTPIIITLLTNKGGAGKTTVAVNLAATLANTFDKKVLIIDTDLQQNATQHLGMLLDSDDPEKIGIYKEKNFYKAFVKNDDIRNHILPTPWKNLSIVVGDDALSKIDSDLREMKMKEGRMKSILSPLLNDEILGYDFILIDCNPALSKLNEVILCASNYVLIPLEAASFGLRGVNYVIDFVIDIINSEEVETNLDILGIVLNKFDSRKNITKDVMEVLDEMFGEADLLFKTKIPVDTMIEQAQAYGEPIYQSFSKSRANNAYIDLAKEVLNRIERSTESGK